MKPKKLIEKIIFEFRWVLLFCYLKLGYVLILVIFQGCTGHRVDVIDALEAVDWVMVCNLIKSIMTGSYHSFVSKQHDYEGEKTSSGILKVKMSSSLIGISSVFLLQVFLTIGVKSSTPWDILLKYLVLHAAFLLGSIVLALVEFIHVKTDYYEALTTELEYKLHANRMQHSQQHNKEGTQSKGTQVHHY